MQDDILALYDEVKTSYLHSWNDSNTLGQNLTQLFQDCIYRCQYPQIIATYSMLSTRVSLCTPLLILQGQQGTGKSTVLDIICQIRGIDKPFACGQSTYASLRNYVEKYKLKHIGDKLSFNDGLSICLDNLHSNHLVVGEPLYNFLLTGYDRKTSKVSIATQKVGESMDFDTFCPKVISTVHDIYQDTSLPELKRRLIMIEFKKYDQLFINSVKRYSFKGIHEQFINFWAQENIYREYVQQRLMIDTYAQENDGISEKLLERLEISLDLLTTSLLIGCFPNYSQLFDYYSEYYEHMFQSKGVLDDYLEAYINSSPNPKVILIAQLKKYIDACKSNGYIDSNISFKKIKEILCTNFNYKLTKDGLIKQ